MKSRKMYVFFAIATVAILSASNSSHAQIDSLEISPAQIEDMKQAQAPIPVPYRLSREATEKAFEVFAGAMIPSYFIDFIGMPPTKMYYLSSVQCVRKGFKEYECDALEPSLKAAPLDTHRKLYSLLSELPSLYANRSIDPCLVGCSHSFYVTRTLFSDRAQRYLALKCAEHYTGKDNTVRMCEIALE